MRSGMLPGYVSGYYTYEECHVDLALLASFAGARLVIATATGVDTKVGVVPTIDGLPITRGECACLLGCGSQFVRA